MRHATGEMATRRGRQAFPQAVIRCTINKLKYMRGTGLAGRLEPKRQRRGHMEKIIEMPDDIANALQSMWTSPMKPGLAMSIGEVEHGIRNILRRAVTSKRLHAMKSGELFGAELAIDFQEMFRETFMPL